MSSSSSTRSSQIFHRSLRKTYPIATSGKGVYLYSSDGTRTLDGSSGAAVSCLGHGHEAVIQAIIDQAQRLAFAHTSFFSNDPAEELAQLLIERSDRAFSRVLYLSSGSSVVCTDSCLFSSLTFIDRLRGSGIGHQVIQTILSRP